MTLSIALKGPFGGNSIFRLPYFLNSCFFYGSRQRKTKDDSAEHTVHGRKESLQEFFVGLNHSGRKGAPISYCVDIVAVAVATVLVDAVAVEEGPVPISYRIASASTTIR